MSEDFVDLRNLRKKDYSKYYLKMNPFPTSAVPEEVPPFTADREREKEHFKNMIGELINNNRTSVTVFVGEYGSGKSHLIRAFKHVVNKQLFSFSDGAYAIYVRSPGRNFLDFYMEFIDDIKRENLTVFAERIISDYIANNRSTVKKFIYDDELKKRINVIEEDIPLLLQSSMIIDMFKDIANKNFTTLKNTDVLYSLLYTAHPTLSAYSWKWFLGSKLTRDEMEYINVRSSIDNPRTAYAVLNDFIKILNIIGIRYVVVFADELEKLTTIPSNLRTVYQDDLRHLIDDYPHGMGIFFAITAFHWQQLNKETTALTRRLEDYVYGLELFKAEQVKELIEKYLEYGRMTEFDKSKMIKECEPTLYPFTNESVEEIYALTQGVCSKIIRLCRKCIEYLIEEGKGGVVTVDLVQKLYS